MGAPPATDEVAVELAEARTTQCELDVGITQYVSDHAGFVGVVKSRYSDFHVNEIDEAGKLLVLTDCSVPKRPSEDTNPEAVAEALNTLVTLLTQDKVDTISQIAEHDKIDGQVKHIDIDVTAMDKETRTAIHNALKVAFNRRLTANTISEGEEKVENRNENKGKKGGRPDKRNKSKREESKKEETQEDESKKELTQGDESKKEAEETLEEEKNGEEEAKEEEKVPRKLIRVFKSNRGRDSLDRRWPFPGEYVHFLVYKENKDTSEVVSMIADHLHMHPSCVHYCGTKDKRGVTTQKFCIKKRAPTQIVKAVSRVNTVHLGNWEFSKVDLKLGDLTGNRFRIALRHVTADRESVEVALRNVKEHGFINYFGMQRFGNCASAATHLVGVAVLRSDYKKACELILKPRPGEKPFMQQIRQHWWRTRDAASSLALFRYKSKAIEYKVLEGLAKEGNNNFAGALGSKVPRNQMLMYLHAFQSLLFNRVASRRIAEYGLQLMPGDLVYRHQDAKDPAVEAEGDSELPPNSDDVEAAANGESVGGGVPEESAYKRMVRPLTAEDIASQRYTIFDLVLPLPGHDVTYPANAAAEWYAELLAEFGLTAKHFSHPVKSYSLPGSYRRVLMQPKAMSWQWCRYNDPNDTLIQSDWERICARRGKTKEEVAKDAEGSYVVAGDEPEKGKYQGLILEFTLPSSIYATMMLRELMKGDTSTASQIKLQQQEQDKMDASAAVEGGVAEEQAVAVKRPAPQEDDEEAAAKKAKLGEEPAAVASSS